MGKQIIKSFTRLPIQIISSFFVLIFLTAVAIGAPAIGIIRDQMERQAWVLVDQGRSTTLVVYAEIQSEMENLAILTSQRPTLLSLIEEGDLAEIQSYLETYLSGTNLDLVIVCRPDDQPLAQAGSIHLDDLCSRVTSSGFYTGTSGSSASASLLGVQPIQLDFEEGYRVIVGNNMDSEMMLEVRRHTGLEQTLLSGDQFIATTFPGGQQAWEELSFHERQAGGIPGSQGRSESNLADSPYFSIRFALNGSLQSIVSLQVEDIANAQRELTFQLGAGLLSVIVLGFVLAVYLTRRISRPLVQLEKAAIRLRKGDLETPVSINTQVSEAAQVAYALEDARSNLHFTLEELRREKAWVSHLLESVVEGIITLDQYGRITYFSPGAERMSGCRQDEILGYSCDEVFLPLEGDRSFSQLLPPPGKQQRLLVGFPSGRQAALAITGSQLAPPEAGKARVALVLRDVSEEEAIHRFFGSYIGNITHEFRTPLAALAASVELLIDQLPDLELAELSSLLNSVRLGVFSLQTLIDNLLEGASIEAGHFQVYVRPSNLASIVGEVIRLIQPLVDKYHLALDASIPNDLPAVQADPRRTSQVLINLLANAIKHSPGGSTISIRAVPGDKEVRVEIADEGPGVPDEMKAGLFRRFVHPDPNHGGIDHGAGLGLPVVKAIVEAQGGQVGIGDNPGGGAVFWFTLAAAAIDSVHQELKR